MTTGAKFGTSDNPKAGRETPPSRPIPTEPFRLDSLSALLLYNMILPHSDLLPINPGDFSLDDQGISRLSQNLTIALGQMEIDYELYINLVNSKGGKEGLRLADFGYWNNSLGAAAPIVIGYPEFDFANSVRPSDIAGRTFSGTVLGYAKSDTAFHELSGTAKLGIDALAKHDLVINFDNYYTFFFMDYLKSDGYLSSADDDYSPLYRIGGGNGLADTEFDLPTGETGIAQFSRQELEWFWYGVSERNISEGAGRFLLEYKDYIDTMKPVRKVEIGGAFGLR
ncbi:MAG: hypothetical protein FWD15_06380 [Alphaproteobacteria bacterium]|nr:hypothetical protein [Alphaproteobacteria bacterium]